MRKQISKITTVRKGDLFRAVVKLPNKLELARVSIWCRVGNYSFSPFSPLEYEAIVGNNMLSPMYVRLTNRNKKHVFEFKAPETMSFVVKQETDNGDTLFAKVKVQSYGTTSAKIRRILRDIGRFIWR